MCDNQNFEHFPCQEVVEDYVQTSKNPFLLIAQSFNEVQGRGMLDICVLEAS